MNSDLAGLLSAVRAYHAEDTPRLVLADYLREHGQEERGEFIAVQCRLGVSRNLERCPFCGTMRRFGWNERQADGSYHEWSDCPNDHKWDATARKSDLARERELLDTEWVPFGPPGPPSRLTHHVGFNVFNHGRGEDFGMIFSRGFLSKLRCSWADAAAHLDSILADPWVPGLDEVELTEVPMLSLSLGRAELSGMAGGIQIPAETDYAVPRVQADGWRRQLLSLRWRSVRSWKLPPEPREEPPANYNYASAYAANAARRGR